MIRYPARDPGRDDPEETLSQTESYRVITFYPFFEKQVGALAREILCDEYGALPDLDSEADLRDIHLAYVPPAARCMIAVEGRTLLGVAGILRVSDTDCELKRFLVRKDRRREGIASALVSALLPMIRAQGYRRIFYRVLPKMELDPDVYGRFGFSEAEPEEGLPGEGRYMVLRLPGREQEPR